MCGARNHNYVKVHQDWLLAKWRSELMKEAKA
jgi:hypothetical protein